MEKKVNIVQTEINSNGIQNSSISKQITVELSPSRGQK